MIQDKMTVFIEIAVPSTNHVPFKYLQTNVYILLTDQVQLCLWPHLGHLNSNLILDCVLISSQ